MVSVREGESYNMKGGLEHQKLLNFVCFRGSDRGLG